MKCSPFMATVIATHVFFILAHINRHSQFVGQSFRRQKNERLLESLVHRKQELASQLYALKDRDAIKEYAQRVLKMQPVALAQVKKLNANG